MCEDADMTTVSSGIQRGAPATDQPVVELRGITKRFPGVVANSDVNLVVRRGEIHAIVGENGSG